MQRTAELDLVRRGREGAEELTAGVVVEHKLDLYVNEEPVGGLSCLPGELEPLAVGFCFTEGIIRRPSELGSVTVSDDFSQVRVEAEMPAERVRALAAGARLTTGCGRGVSLDNVADLMDCEKPFNMMLEAPAALLMDRAVEFARASELHKSVGGVHSAALIGADQALEFHTDDISRHCAIDKAVGKAILQGRDVSRMILVCTGRLSFEMVSKAARMRMPIAVTLLSVTREAALLARRFHIAVCGRARANRLDIYSCPWRIK